MMIYNDIKTAGMVECRRDARNDVTEDEIYYVVHKVAIGNARWYHHGIVLADSLDAVGAGIFTIQKMIKDECTDKLIATPVLMRNMMSFDEEVLDSSAKQDIDVEIERLHSSQNGKFVVFGIVGKSQITLITIGAFDAFEAAGRATELIFTQSRETFLPLNVSFASPVIEQLEPFVEKTVSDIKVMLAASPELMTH